MRVFQHLILQEDHPFQPKALQNMTGTSPNKSQPDIFRPLLTSFIDTNHKLTVLADRIERDYFEDAFASHTGQPATPIRFMVGCLLLKRIYDYGDETLAKAWVMNPYMRQSHLFGAVFLWRGLFPAHLSVRSRRICSFS